MMAHDKTKEEYMDILSNNQEYADAFLTKCITCSCLMRKVKTSAGAKTCSDICSRTAKQNINKGRNQSEETIKNRVNNTDQIKKESKRKQTMIEKYGNVFFFPDEESRNRKISESLKGKSHSKEHQEKVIESKRRNGTLKHKQTTKDKIREKLEQYYQECSECITLSKNPTNNGKGHKTGFLNGILFRSSYEELFILSCIQKGIQIQSAENKSMRIRYIGNDGKYHWYYPDFFLPGCNTTIEIKPTSMVQFSLEKINAAKELLGNNFTVLDISDILNPETYEKFI